MNDPSEDFARSTEWRDASVVVAFAALALVLVAGDGLGVPHVLWYGPFFPALAEDIVPWQQKGSLAVLDQVGGNSITARGLSQRSSC